VTSLFRDEKAIYERVGGFGSKAREINRALAMDTQLDGVDLRVFLYLTSCLNFEAYLPVPQLEIAEALGRRKEHISRSMAQLKAREVVFSGPKVGRASTWRLNPNYGKQQSAERRRKGT
jgi:CRP-like cAMP-binding protein